ncbi:MAG: MAPEG family protein [Myxococcota bacterium]
MGTVLGWFSLCTVILFVKMFALSLYQGVLRMRSRSFLNPEDARFVGKPALAEELAPVRRAAQAWLNDLENIPAFFALGLVYVLSSASPSAAPWLMVTFTIARIVHSVVFLRRVQPWRTIAYVVGVGCLFAMCWNILVTVVVSR